MNIFRNHAKTGIEDGSKFKSVTDAWSESAFPHYGTVLIFSSVQSLSHIWLFTTPWTVARKASLSITNSWGLLKLWSIESDAIRPSHTLWSPSLPAFNFLQHQSFQMSQFFTSCGQSPGVSASASVLPKNTQDWSPLEWISLQSKALSRVFSNTTVQKHQFFSAQLSLQSNSHIHTWPVEKL